MERKDRELVERLTLEANTPKRALMALCSKIDAISPSKAKKLDKIIAKLEKWQNEG